MVTQKVVTQSRTHSQAVNSPGVATEGPWEASYNWENWSQPSGLSSKWDQEPKTPLGWLFQS
jgi:hypothetical protein